MPIHDLIQTLEEKGLKFSIWRKTQLRIHRSPAGYTAITPQIMDELAENRAEIVAHLRSRAAVQFASPQRREEPPVIQVKGKRLTEQQLKFIDALTYADTLAQAGRIAGYGTRQAAHKAYNSLLKRLPGVLRRALSTRCIRQDEQEL